MRDASTKTKSTQGKRDTVSAIAGAVGPPNAPSVPAMGPADGEVKITWTASPATYPGGYDLHYTINGGRHTTIRQAISTVSVFVENGDEVCAELAGYDNGVRSAWCATQCATAAIIVAAAKKAPKTKSTKSKSKS